jgi:gliding motility-associated-like protein
MLKKLSVLFFLLISMFSYAQRGKNNNFTVTATGTQVNAYTTLTSNAAINAVTISVSNNTLTNAVMPASLAAGDLILIIQMQGASMDIDPANVSFTTPSGHQFDWYNYLELWGQITNYNNAGKYELVEVKSVTGTTSINLMCGLKNNYTASGHVQIVRIPRFQDLTLNANTTIVPALWDGSVGGVLAIEVNGNVSMGTNSKMSASAYGFRGGTVDATSGGPAGSATDTGFPAANDQLQGSEKGEGIGGSVGNEYNALLSRYGKGAPANGGGGGNYKNSGGGGGSNIGSGAYTGKGIPVAGYTVFWNLEQAGLATSVSSGGGRGGYSGAQSNQDESVLGPNNAAWAGDYRRKEGGFGGHPLTYDATRLFMGGGGGAGDMDNGQGGNGGRGGGIVLLQVYGTVSGTGTIEANGANGQNSNPNGLTASASSTTKYGNDGAGGGGAGGAISISNAANLPATLSLTANGGNGGNQAMSYGQFATPAEANGPGGSGSGGMIAFASGTPGQSVLAGTAGIVTTTTYPVNIVANFPPNGATNGNAGQSGIANSFFTITAANATICSGATATLTAVISGTGTLPLASSLTWYASQFGTVVVGSGATFTTPVLTSTTTYYVGVCPGTFRIPVTVTVGGPTISGTAVVANATCTTAGSITGLTSSGGVAPITIQWNGVTTPGMNLTNASANTYTVVVTDNVGCTATSGPYTITSSGGPTVSTASMTVVNESCAGNDGSILGITASGNGLTYSWNNGGGNALNATNLSAGSYTLTVTDNLGCTATAGPIVVATTVGISINATNMVVTNETCSNSNGSITGISITGTATSLTWNGNSAPSTSLTGLAAGNYTLIATNAIGCSDTLGPIAISNSPSPIVSTANSALTNEHCSSADGSIQGLTVSNGTLPYSYSWNGGAYTSLNLTNLVAGNYTLTVSDANGCTASAGPFVLQNMAAPIVNISGVQITPESCSGLDGAITGIVASGSSSLTYSWNLTPNSSIDLTDITAGTYGLVVTDAFGCSTPAGPFTVNGAVPMSIDSSNLVILPSGCTMDIGSIAGLVVIGGVNPQVNWSNGPQTILNNNLAAGSYQLTVNDDQNCNLTATFQVGTLLPPVISVNSAIISASNCGQNDGSIAGVVVTNGTMPYTYEWDNVSTQNGLDLSGVAQGIHTLQVTDSVGCVATAQFTVGNVSGPTINSTGLQVINSNCELANGAINGLVINGNGPYTYDWTNTSLTSLNLTGISAGNYALTVTDINGCSASIPAITITTTPVPNANFSYTSGILIPMDNVNFQDQSTGATVTNWAWNIESFGLVSTASNCAQVFPTEGTFTITLVVSTANGCVDSISKEITIYGDLIIPNVLTRNNDGVNDVFEISNLKPNSQFIVQNRWGNVVFETDNYDNNWKGTDQQGTLLTDGIYFYQLITPENQVVQGYVQLLIK